MVGDTSITCLDIFEQLQELPSMEEAQARELLDPVDKQNVPKAVNLFQELQKVSILPLPVHPAKRKQRKALVFFTQIINHFLLPFISVTWSLSEQICSLSAYAHLIFAMYRKHGTAFMTGALYADSQAIVKNIIITLARLQEVDPDLPFFIILEGTDRLENIFSDCRTQDHSRNFDIHQLSQKLSTGAVVQSIFERNPDLDRGHRRLNLKDAMGIDHVNPRSWKGNVRVGDVDVGLQWSKGKHIARQELIDYFGAALSDTFDFTRIFQEKGIDLLRPLGAVVGVQETPDDMRTEQVERGSAIESHRRRTLGPLLEEQQPAPTPAEEPTTNSNDNDTSEITDGLDIDDFFPDIPRESETLPPDTEANISAPNQYLEFQGRKFLKSSLVTALLTPYHSRKVTMRTLRAQGVTIRDLQKSSLNLPSGNLEDEDLIKSGDIAAALVRVGSEVCLAVLEIRRFQDSSTSDKIRLSSIEAERLEQHDKPITVTAQILRLEDKRPPGVEVGFWEWTGQYLRFGETPGTTLETQRQYTLDIPGYLVHPLGPDITEDSYRWSLSHRQLDEVKDHAWACLEPESEALAESIRTLPDIKMGHDRSGLPYTDCKGK